ncbi:hypothetical protein Scep_025862 [Stephania cephalantha]|uniref:Uncharacterized protein n=1 Tax=Stephania cephalantha TaxID=152367 RepID=A0AAP0HMP3_9MAGN
MPHLSLLLQSQSLITKPHCAEHGKISFDDDEDGEVQRRTAANSGEGFEATMQTARLLRLQSPKQTNGDGKPDGLVAVSISATVEISGFGREILERERERVDGE